jgi:hypothetical protein
LAEAIGVRTPTGVLAATVHTNIFICPIVPAGRVNVVEPVTERNDTGVIRSISPVV